MNVWSVIIIIAIVAAEATAVVSIVKKRKKGGSCGYGCSDSYTWSAGGRTKK